MLLIRKLIRPISPQAIYVDRPRLYQQLNQWKTVRAILVRAPAGYGKSSLVSRWIDLEELDQRSAWLSLDEHDGEPVQFVRYMAAALSAVAPGLLAWIEPVLQDNRISAQQALTKLLLAFQDGLVPSINPKQHLLLVLDDLHRLQSPAIDALILRMLEHGPEELHLLLLTRQPTELSLARLYAQGQIGALTTDDLRLREEEVAAYLYKAGFASPSPAAVEQVTSRTQGWAMALQMAVLATRSRRSSRDSLRGSIEDLLSSLRGDEEWMKEYLLQEVLEHLEPGLRRFLLQTSILDAFTAPLCAAVTGDPVAFARLTEIDRADLFMIRPGGNPSRNPGSNEEWFRYHHLFQELLQHRLHMQSSSAEVRALHQRAADWLANAGEVPAAVRHFLAAGDADAAAMLVETEVRGQYLQNPYYAQRMINLLPHELLHQRPRLMLDRCRLAMLRDDANFISLFQQAQPVVQAIPQSDPNYSALRAELFVFAAICNYYQRAYTESLQAIEQVQNCLPHLDDFMTGALYFIQMHLRSRLDNHAEAMQLAEKAVLLFQRVGYGAGEVALRRELALWQVRSGNVQTATLQLQALLKSHQQTSVPMVARELTFIHLYAAENSYWQNQLAEAKGHMGSLRALATQLQDEELMRFANLAAWAYGINKTQAIGDRPALADRKQFSNKAAYEYLIDIWVRQLVAVGECEAAWEAAQDLSLILSDDAEQMPDLLLFAYALAYIARGVDLAAITPLLAGALARRTKKENTLVRLRLLALLAWQQLRLHGADAARPPLAQAAEIAREMGYVRVLLNIPELLPLLSDMDLLDIPAADGSVELTEQEQRVLQLLAEEHTYQQIANEMTVSINTVRTHVRNTYGKLSVNRRDQAVHKGRSQGLIVLDAVKS